MRKRGISIIEILIVIAILALLTALLLPVVIRSKRSAQATVCTSNLRQAHIAWSLYLENNDGQEPRYIDEFIVSSGERKIAVCPLDDSDNGIGREIRPKAERFKLSYFGPHPQVKYHSDLHQADSNHGILVCVLHGTWKKGYTFPRAELGTTGLVLRLRSDGSVQRAKVGSVCVGSPTSGIASTRSNWTLMTDAWPCPEPYCPAGSFRCP